MARERVVEAYFNKKVKDLGGISVKILPATAGVPDRLVLLPGGRLFLVELKRTKGGSLRPIQRVFHAKALARGYRIPVLSGKEEVDQWLKMIG